MGFKKLIGAAVVALGLPALASAATVEGPVIESGNLDGAEFTFIPQTETLVITATGPGDFSVTVDFTTEPSNLFALFEFTPSGPTVFTDVIATFSFGDEEGEGEGEPLLVVASIVSTGTGTVTDGSGDDLGLLLFAGGPATSLTIEGSATGVGVLEASVTAIPLPAGGFLVLTGLAGLGLVARRREKAAA